MRFVVIDTLSLLPFVLAITALPADQPPEKPQAGIATKTVLTSSAPASLVGEMVTFSVSVKADSPDAGVPGGTITFLEGDTVLGQVNLLNGSAKLNINSLATGDHKIVVVFSSDGKFSGSSASLTQKVKAQSARDR